MPERWTSSTSSMKTLVAPRFKISPRRRSFRTKTSRTAPISKARMLRRPNAIRYRYGKKVTHEASSSYPTEDSEDLELQKPRFLQVATAEKRVGSSIPRKLGVDAFSQATWSEEGKGEGTRADIPEIKMPFSQAVKDFQGRQRKRTPDTLAVEVKRVPKSDSSVLPTSEATRAARAQIRSRGRERPTSEAEELSLPGQSKVVDVEIPSMVEKDTELSETATSDRLTPLKSRLLHAAVWTEDNQDADHQTQQGSQVSSGEFPKGVLRPPRPSIDEFGIPRERIPQTRSSSRVRFSDASAEVLVLPSTSQEENGKSSTLSDSADTLTHRSLTETTLLGVSGEITTTPDFVTERTMSLTPSTYDRSRKTADVSIQSLEMKTPSSVSEGIQVVSDFEYWRQGKANITVKDLIPMPWPSSEPESGYPSTEGQRTDRAVRQSSCLPTPYISSVASTEEPPDSHQPAAKPLSSHTLASQDRFSRVSHYVASTYSQKVIATLRQEITRLNKEIERREEMWNKKFLVLKRSLYAIKDESYTRHTIAKRAAVLHQAHVSYWADTPQPKTSDRNVPDFPVLSDLTLTQRPSHDLSQNQNCNRDGGAAAGLGLRGRAMVQRQDSKTVGFDCRGNPIPDLSPAFSVSAIPCRPPPSKIRTEEDDCASQIVSEEESEHCLPDNVVPLPGPPSSSL